MYHSLIIARILMLQQGEIVFIIVKKCFTINPNKFLYDISNMLERDNYG